MEIASSPRISPHAQRVFAEHFQHIGQQRDAGAKQDEADNIERIGFFAIVRQMQIDQEQADQADRKVHEKDDPPVEISDDQARRRWARAWGRSGPGWRRSSWRGSVRIWRTSAPW